MENVTPNSAMSFYDKAAWYAFIAPFATVGLGCLINWVADELPITRAANHDADSLTTAVTLFILFICFVFALSIGCRFRQHRRKLTLWLAVLAVMASIGLGVLTAIVLALMIQPPSFS